MKTLLELSIEATNKNISSNKKSSKNMNQYLHEILFEQKQKLTKENIIGIISYERMKIKNPSGLEKITTVEEMEKFLKSENITVKNGFETSWCKGQNNSSYHYNPIYKNYKFEKVGNLFQITSRK